MARLFLARETTPHSPFGNTTDIEKASLELPPPGLHTSYYGQCFNVEQLKIPVLPHLYVGPDPAGQLRNGLHFKRLTTSGVQQLRDAVILVNTLVTPIQLTLHSVDDGVVLTRSHNDQVSGVVLLFDEIEDKAMRLEQGHIEVSLSTVMPLWAKAYFRLAEKRLVYLHEINELRNRSWLSPRLSANGNEVPGGAGLHPVKNRLLFGAIRDVLEGRALLADVKHNTFYLPYRSHMQPLVPLFHKNLAKTRDRMLSDIMETRQARPASTGRRMTLGATSTFDRAHVTSFMRPMSNDDHTDYGGGALAFGFTPGYGQLAKPTYGLWHPCMSNVPLQGLETLGGGKPFMLVTSTPYCWLAYAFIPAETKLLPTDVTECFTSTSRIHNFMEFQMPAGRIAYHIVIPMSIDHADMVDVAARNSTVKGLDPATTETIREVPYLGAFLQDCLLTLKGQIKRFYPDLANVKAFAENHFPCTFAHHTYTWDEKDSLNGRTFHPAPCQGTPRTICNDGLNYQLLVSSDQASWNKLFGLLSKARTTIPQHFFPEMSVNAYNGVKTDDLQPVSPKSARVLDL